MGNEIVNFEFYVRAIDIDTYKQREEFLAELKSLPGLEVSSTCESAADTGIEQFVVNVIAAVGSITTIADFIFKYFRNKKRSKKTPGRSIVVYVPADGEIILNNLEMDEIVRVISTSSSYAILSKPTEKTRKRTRKLRKKSKSKKD